MEVIRKLTIIAVFFVTWVLFIYVGAMLGLSFGDPPMPIAELFIGFLGGLVLGVPLAMGCAKLFGKYVWPDKPGRKASMTEGDDRQQQSE